ncbi:paraflagellar rod component, putative [Trypanosoma equiperdum]|uniref:EF-hand domain-containing protein n=2 Tax=Trypanozoon TaxID=39700 RepID=Q57WB1_TRYB2|nr:hypothetical protein, conserved [Trypanosoma brucei brucei TREU927]AAX70121.1 hypothetical protein, conserved [Trypanosoma brucei]AAZ10408.1 hypothetical protein, conserved [Trypanosoma brucei brucei TREU927]SCU66075.1 paraflagellar rod component, putative [Trypanosoma equiperdum]
MSTQLISGGEDGSHSQLMDLVLTNCSRPQSRASDNKQSTDGVVRLTSYVDLPNRDTLLPPIAEPKGGVPETSETLFPRRLGFDMIGVSSVSEEMLRDLYEVFDVHQSGGVERGVLREMMRSGFSHFGAPCSDRDLDRFFENVTPFRVRRRRTPKEGEVDVVPFNEFCVAFLSWLRR